MLTILEHLSYNQHMHSVATIVIPVANHHRHTVMRAIASAQAQTVPCDVLPYYDVDGRGAGHARNEGMRDTETPFIVFLDADDTLHPAFVERCLATYQTGRYVYTAWDVGGAIRKPKPCNPYAGGGYHLVTTLFPTRVFQAIGGFDETLPGYEDTDFYLRAAKHGICGLYCDEPLVHYTGEGRRSQAFLKRDDYQSIKRQVYERNGGEAAVMGCCGGEGVQAAPMMGDHYEGDVRALALWSGVRTEGSHYNPARVYRGGNGQEMWVDPRDVKARPHLFKQVFDVSQLAPDRDDVLQASGLV